MWNLCSGLLSSSSTEHHSRHPALLCGPGGPECHRVLPNRQLPSIRCDSEENDQRHGVELQQRHIPAGERHGQWLRLVSGQRDQRSRVPD